MTTRHIIKNLILVRQFTRQNMRSIEFDPFGFHVIDYQTKQTLMRCDSTNDLYPITTPTHQVFCFCCSVHLASASWLPWSSHKQLVDNHSNSFFFYKDSILRHACQLGKHVKLPFSFWNYVPHFPFEIVHYDVWTSPIESISGIKYYDIFWMGFLIFVGIYLTSQIWSVF